MRRRRLARLAGLETAAPLNGTVTISASPGTPGSSTHQQSWTTMESHNQQQSPQQVQRILQQQAQRIQQQQPQQVQQAQLTQQPQQAQLTQQPQQIASMDVEENSDKQSSTFSVDVDSGIENMEVEESDRKDGPPRSRVSLNLSFYILSKHY